MTTMLTYLTIRSLLRDDLDIVRSFRVFSSFSGSGLKCDAPRVPLQLPSSTNPIGCTSP